jgi:hypothetical protein
MTIDSMTSAACLVNRPELCSGQVISLAYVGPCLGPAHDPAPVDPEQELEDLLAEEADRLSGWDFA